jgi:hypothetical protein
MAAGRTYSLVRTHAARAGEDRQISGTPARRGRVGEWRGRLGKHMGNPDAFNRAIPVVVY